MSAPESAPAAGRLRLLAPDGAELEAAEASFAVGPEALVAHPRQQPVLRVDYADVDAFERGDYVFALRLASGERVEASMLGRRFNETADACALALTAFQARNLLLEEPGGGEAFAGDVARDGAEAPAEVRVYRTSLAVLPRGAVPYAIPLGEVASVGFDEGRYSVDLATASGPVSLLRLGKKTHPCLRLLESRLTELRRRTAEAVAYLAPGLPTLTARRLAQALPDGVPASKVQLDAISPELWPTLIKAAVADARLRASFEELLARCPPGEAALGVKETNARQDLEPEAEGEPPPDAEEGAVEAPEPEVAADAEGGESPMAGRVAWLAFPIWSEDRTRPGNAVAIEAVTRGGRATYLFRIAPPGVYRGASTDELRELARERVRSVSRALVALTFKREPIYLPDEKIRSGPYARYRLALRLSAPLKDSRASFVGRAIHGPGWARQLESALERARG